MQRLKQPGEAQMMKGHVQKASYCARKTEMEEILTPFSEEHPGSLSLFNSPSVSPKTELSPLI